MRFGRKSRNDRGIESARKARAHRNIAAQVQRHGVSQRL